MTDTAAGRIADRLTSTFGLHFSSRTEAGSGGSVISLYPSDLSYAEGFTIRIATGWRHVMAEFVAGNLAMPLLHEMAAAGTEPRRQSTVFAVAAGRAGLDVRMAADGAELDPARSESWPSAWSRLQLSVTKWQVDVHQNSLTGLASGVAVPVAGMVLALLPVEETGTASTGLPEGAVTRVAVNRYERSRINRAACIAIHGSTCAACGFDFGKVYGPELEGFIHVHHITPVSELGEDYVVDPAHDLIPLCPNCHAVVHHDESTLGVDDLRRALEKAAASADQP